MHTSIMSLFERNWKGWLKAYLPNIVNNMCVNLYVYLHNTFVYVYVNKMCVRMLVGKRHTSRKDTQLVSKALLSANFDWKMNISLNERSEF